MVQLLLVFLLVCTGAWADPDGNPDAHKPRDFRSMNPEMRLRLWELSQLPPDQLQSEVAKWPRYQKMSPEKQAQLITQIQDLNVRMHEMAMAKAREYGLQIAPESEQTFANTYVRRRLEEEKKIWDQMKPLREKMEETLKAEMIQQFGPK